MRTFLFFLFGCSVACATTYYPSATLNPNNAVKLAPLTGVEYLQGKPPISWEDGKVYIIDCWATWCIPCKTTIPRLNALYNDYQTKGLRVIGVSVFGEDKTKVESYIKNQGSLISYPLAVAAKDGAFENDWLKAATAYSLPSAFVIKNGKLLFITHPGKITKETIEALLAGGKSEAEALRKFQPAGTPAESSADNTVDQSPTISFLLKGSPGFDYPLGAVQYMDQILAKNPSLPAEKKQEILHFKASYLIDLRKFDEALQVLDEAKALAPDSKPAHLIENGIEMLKLSKTAIK